MGFFDEVVPALAGVQANAAKGKKKPMGSSMFNPQPEAAAFSGFPQTDTQPQGKTTAQVFDPLIQRMAGRSAMSPMNRNTMDGTGQGLTKPEAWNGMFNQGAKDLTPQQLASSQGATAMNQWANQKQAVPPAPGAPTALPLQPLSPSVGTDIHASGNPTSSPEMFQFGAGMGAKPEQYGPPAPQVGTSMGTEQYGPNINELQGRMTPYLPEFMQPDMKSIGQGIKKGAKSMFDWTAKSLNPSGGQ